MSHDKAALRKDMLVRRSALDPDEARAASETISRRLLADPLIGAARTVLAFWPMTGRAEVDIRPAVRALATRGVRVGLPIVQPGDDSRRLVFGLFTSENALSPGPFGVLEPAASARLDARSADVVVVPALAATRAGFRLGYGGGYYDRFLATTCAYSVVPLFDVCLVDSLPVEPHDRVVDAVITETEQIRVGASA